MTSKNKVLCHPFWNIFVSSRQNPFSSVEIGDSFLTMFVILDRNLCSGQPASYWCWVVRSSRLCEVGLVRMSQRVQGTGAYGSGGRRDLNTKLRAGMGLTESWDSILGPLNK